MSDAASQIVAAVIGLLVIVGVTAMGGPAWATLGFAMTTYFAALAAFRSYRGGGS